MATQGLVHGPLGGNCLHICVDMQLLFAPGGPWAVPWMEKVLPAIVELVAKYPERTLFSRFIPAERPGEAPGTWSRYYRRWADVTLARIDIGLVELVPLLARFVPPAKVIDKRVYSPWTEGNWTSFSWFEGRHAGGDRRRNRRMRAGHGTRCD